MINYKILKIGDKIKTNDEWYNNDSKQWEKHSGWTNHILRNEDEEKLFEKYTWRRIVKQKNIKRKHANFELVNL